MKTIGRCILLAFLLTAGAGSALAAGLSGDDILKRMDANTSYRSIEYDGTLAIYSGDAVRTKDMKATAVGTSKAIAEFTNPEDKGTKFLKIDKNLWIYFPSEQDTVKISGHMLKEGIMGSDVSYQDALESDDLFKKYAVTVSGEETVDGRACYVLTLNATVKDVQYETRKMWVDEERFVALRQEEYAKSGKLLKVSRVLDVRKIGDRWFPVKEEISDQLKQGSRTQFIMADVRLDVPVSETLFSLRNLGR
ncbi:MAG: outer membrane lipoprotein-sorting protein [Spirochaetia bacterium]|jgi:outer membrane lipoprotein-sorting protein